MSWMQMNHFSRHNLVADQKRFKSTHHTIYTSLDTSLPSVLGATNTWIVENWFHSENHSQHSLLKKKKRNGSLSEACSGTDHGGVAIVNNASCLLLSFYWIISPKLWVSLLRGTWSCYHLYTCARMQNFDHFSVGNNYHLTSGGA